MSTLTDVQKALHNSQVLDQHWITGGYDALSLQMEEELKKEEILGIHFLVEQVEPDLEISIGIQQQSFSCSVPIADVTALTDTNAILHIHSEDLYPDWKDRITKKVSESRRISTREVNDGKGGLWNRSLYKDELGTLRVVSQRM